MHTRVIYAALLLGALWLGMESIPARAQGDRLTLYAGTLTTSTAAAPLGTAQAVFDVTIQNDPDNSVAVFIGTRQLQPIQLEPADSIQIPISNIDQVYVKAASGTPLVNWLARGR